MAGTFSSSIVWPGCELKRKVVISAGVKSACTFPLSLRDSGQLKTCLAAQSCLTLVIPWTEEPGRLQSMVFFRQEYWSRLPFPAPGNRTCVSCIGRWIFNH